MSIGIYSYTYTHMCVYIHTYIYICKVLYINLCVYTDVYMYVCLWTYIHLHRERDTDVYRHMYIYICVYTEREREKERTFKDLASVTMGGHNKKSEVLGMAQKTLHNLTMVGSLASFLHSLLAYSAWATSISLIRMPSPQLLCTCCYFCLQCSL